MLALLAAMAICAMATGCGDGDSSTTTVKAAEEGSTPEDAVAPDASEMEAIESTIKTWLLQGDCDLMTDHFLEEQTSESKPARACKTFEVGFNPPSYSEDDIKISNVTYANDKATATVGGSENLTSGGEEVTSTYKLVLSDGSWRIGSARID